MRCVAAAVLLLALPAGCGRPKPAAKPVPAVKLTVANFDAEVKAVRGRPVLVHFSSAGCYHCKAVRKMLGQLQGDYGERLKVAELEIGSARGVAAPLKVAKAPTLLFFRDGEEVGRLEGGPNREAIEPMVERVLAGKPAGKPAVDTTLADPADVPGTTTPAPAIAPAKTRAGAMAPAGEDDDPENDPDVIEVMKGWEGTALPTAKTGKTDKTNAGGEAGQEAKTGP